METDKFVVYAEKLDHTIFCIGYRVMQKDLEGTLDAEALKAAGVPLVHYLENQEWSRCCLRRWDKNHCQRLHLSTEKRKKLSLF